MRRYLLIACIILLAQAASAAADRSSIDSFIEFGRKGASGLVEEEDLTDEYYYQKYNIKLFHAIKDRTSYYIKNQYYSKDYDNLENKDNRFNSTGMGLDLPLYSDDAYTIKTGPDFEYKYKGYYDAKNDDYRQFKFDMPFIFKKESEWRVKGSGGINSYDYLYAPKDQFKLNARIETSKKFLKGLLDLSAFYKFQWIDRQKIADRTETTSGCSFDLKIDKPFIKALEGGVESGMDNTIIYEDREDSYDYRYVDWYLKTRHAVVNKIEAGVKYTDLNRTYADFNHNYDGFGIENSWKVPIYDRVGTTADMKITYLHKQFRYPYVSNPLSYHNNNIFSDFELSKKGDWKISVGSDIKFYDYPARRLNDKIYYVQKLTAEKYLCNRDLTLGFEYKYTFKNFLHRLDITEDLFRFRMNFRF